MATFEEPVRNLGTKPKAQALHYFPGLKDAELPRFVMLSDFQSFELYDLEEDESVAFLLTDLPKHIATRPWREARSATAPTVSASFSECRPSETRAVGDRAYSDASRPNISRSRYFKILPVALRGRAAIVSKRRGSL